MSRASPSASPFSPQQPAPWGAPGWARSPRCRGGDSERRRLRVGSVAAADAGGGARVGRLGRSWICAAAPPPRCKHARSAVYCANSRVALSLRASFGLWLTRPALLLRAACTPRSTPRSRSPASSARRCVARPPPLRLSDAHELLSHRSVYACVRFRETRTRRWRT